MIYHEAGRHKTVQLEFPPAGSHLIWCTPERERTKGKYEPRAAKPVVQTIDGDWQIDVLGPNALTLDFVSLDGGEPQWVLKAETEVKAREEGSKFELEYRFHVSDKPEGAQIGLVAERMPRSHHLFVNGTEITDLPTDRAFNDVNFLRRDIDSLAVVGENTVKIAGRVSLDKMKAPVVEAVYVVGNFGVQPREAGFTIGAAPQTVSAHDLTEQGLLFFPGKVKLRKEFAGGADAKELRLCGVDATVVEATINGQSIGKRAWRPFDFAIPKALLQDQNVIELTLSGTLRNLLGPHHHTGGELLSVGPYTFRDYAHWTDSYSFVPFGVQKVCLCV